MSENKYELEELNGTSGSTLELIEEAPGPIVKQNQRLKIGVVFLVLALAGVTIGLVVVITKQQQSDNTESGTSLKNQGNNAGNTPFVPSTQTPPRTPPTGKPEQVLTTSDPGRDWLQEPCQPQETLQCPWKTNPVLLISLDGFRAEYLTRNLTPTLQRLASCGVHTPYMRAVYPTLTFPNHYTIVTGLYPESHGIVDNNMYDHVINKKFSIGGTAKSDPRWWGGEPIWVTAQKQGKKAATYFWVGSDVEISGMKPDIYYQYDGSVTFEDRIDQAIEWLGWPDDQRPDLMTVYFDEPDHTGHGSGPESKEIDAMLGRVDKIINMLMNGLYRRNIHNCVNLMIVADHGMESTSCDRRFYLNKYMNTQEYLIFDGTIGRIHRKYHEQRVGRNYVVSNNTDVKPIAEIEKLLTCKSGHAQMFDKTTMPVRHHYTNNDRIGDIILEMEKRWTVARSSKSYCLKGNHGFDNLYKSMQALFLAHGPDFRQGIGTEPFENIELYNLMCELLNINPSPNNGTLGSLHHILKTPPTLQTPHVVTSPVCKSPENAHVTDESCFCSNKVQLSDNSSYRSPMGKPQSTERTDICTLSTDHSQYGYSNSYKMPVWVSYVLYPNATIENTTKTCISQDPRIQPVPCSTYSNSNKSLSGQFLFNLPGTDSQEDKLSSLMAPMYDGFKNGLSKYLFKLIFDYATTHAGLEVIVGPAFDYNRDGLWEDISSVTEYVKEDGVPIPTHYYLIVLACTQGSIKTCGSENLQVLSFIFPHLQEVPNCMPYEDYLVENVARIRDIELLTGIQFLTKLPVEAAARLRTFLPTSLWQPSKMALRWSDLPCSSQNTATCPGKVPLLLISLDGFRADYVTRKLTPVIEKLRKCGVHTPYMRSVYPTVTFPNHYTIVTGLYPESHGIVSNNMFDADIGEVFSLSSKTKGDPRWWGGEPIWTTAQKQGKKAYTYFWPGSDVNISGSYPEVWVGYDGKIGFPERLQTVIEWLTLPDDKKPDIVTLYFDEPDHAGHQKGPESEMVNGMLETVDEMLGRLMNSLYQQGLQDCVNIIVIADHGMQDVSCSNIVKLPEYMPSDIKKVMAFDGTFGTIENKYIRESKYKIKTDNVTQVPIPKITKELMCKNPAMKVFTKETIPKRLHYKHNKRIGEVLLEMQDGWLVTDTKSFWCNGGNHGWDNLFKSMHALFLAHGPGFKQELEIDPFENIELHNLMSDILGITPAPNNGTMGALRHILSKSLQIPTVKANHSSINIQNPIPVCNCSSVDLNSVDLSPNKTAQLPFGVPAYLKGTDTIKTYTNFASGYPGKPSNYPLWTTVSVQGADNKTDDKFCIVSDHGNENMTCDDLTTRETNLTLRFIHGSYSPFPGVQLVSHLFKVYDGFYNGIWSYVWTLAREYSKKFGPVSVTVGPIIDVNGDGLADDGSDIDSNATFIKPTHFYMILMRCKNPSQTLPCNGEIDVQSFILPNIQKAPNCLNSLDYLKDNVARIRDIELLTGLQFLTENIDQALAARIRTYLPVSLWPVEMIQSWLEKPCPSTPQTCPTDYQPLILISLDGFRADYLLRNFTPYIRKLSQCGVHAPYMRSVYPTKTFPNHYSIVTGLYPESHGIIDNNMYDETIGAWFGMSKANATDPRWWHGEPIWNTVRKHNKTSATYFWPGSDVVIQGMTPNLRKKYDGKIPFNTRVDELLGWLSLPAGKRPDFVTLYFDEPDHAGHMYGPDNIVQIGRALDKVDEAVGRLMEGLYRADLHNCANIIILADHGMSENSCDRIVTLRDYVTQFYNVYAYEGAFGRINNKIAYGRNRPRTVTNPVPVSDIIANMSCKSSHMKVFEKSMFPKRHHYANTNRIADIIVDMEDTWLFTARSLKDFDKRYCNGGNHGYDNFYKSMNALFLAHGPSFKQNYSMEPFENIELYNLMTTVLNITAAPNNGTIGSLNRILRDPPTSVSSTPTLAYNNTYHAGNITVPSRCLVRCPQNSKGSQNMTSTMLEKLHTPYGIPVTQPDLGYSVDLLYSQAAITAFNTVQNYPVWVSFTVHNETTTTSPECVLPDNRVKTLSETTSCQNAENLSNKFSWTSLLSGQSQYSLSSMYVAVYKEFKSGFWQQIQQKIRSWRTKYGNLNIIAGPAFDYNFDGLPDSADDINKTSDVEGVPIPSHIFLIISRCETRNLSSCSKPKTISFILPNIQHENNCLSADDYLTDNEARIKDIELLTGLQFFTNYIESMGIRTFLPHGLWKF